MTASERTDFLLSRYLAREITPAEFDELMIWLMAIPLSDAFSLEAPLQDLWKLARENKLPSGAAEVNWDNMYQTVIASDQRIIPMRLETFYRSCCLSAHSRFSHLPVLTSKTGPVTCKDEPAIARHRCGHYQSCTNPV